MAKLSFIVRLRREPALGQQYIVHMQLSHKSKTRYIDTGLRVGVSKAPAGKLRVNFSNETGMVTPGEYGYIDKNRRLAEMLDRSYLAISGGNRMMDDIDQLAAVIKGEGLEGSARVKTVLSECRRYAEGLERQHKDAEVYVGPRGGVRRMGAEYVTNFLGMMDDWERMMGDMRIEAVTPAVIGRWVEKISEKEYNGKRLSPVTVGKKVGQLRSVFRELQRNGHVFPVDPFAGYKQPRHNRVEKAIDLQMVRQWAEHTPCRKSGQEAIDMWWMSFYSGGMDFADLIKIDWRGDLVKYVRQKVEGRGDEVVVPVGDEMRALLSKYISPDTGRLPWSYMHCRSMSQVIIREGRKCGLPAWFSYKSARKTFAQLAMSLRFTDAEIDYLLGHSERRRGVIFHYNSVSIDDARTLLNAVAMMVKDEQEARRWVAQKRGWI